jgi:hypothetical protein
MKYQSRRHGFEELMDDILSASGEWGNYALEIGWITPLVQAVACA